MKKGKTVLLIGSGPIQIGQAAEFDYSGAQACRALAEEGIRVVLVNSNPATIMTDPEMADKVYIEPITAEIIEEIIKKECPDGVIAGLGGQTGLNVTAELAERGVLEKYGVEIMGTPLDTIYATEDRDLFGARMEKIGQPVPKSEKIRSLEEVENAVEKVGGLPVILRTAYTLGGSGSGVIEDMDTLIEWVHRGLQLSRNSEVQITESLVGWIEMEYEVMRDASDSCIIICNMENIDPMGIHTGESIVVTPSQVIPDVAHQAMRNSALEIIRELGVQGGCNIQFAWRDNGTEEGQYRIVEVNPRVSRSSALASKATGYPIARVTAKVALGKCLHEIKNEITGETSAAFEPAIDYIVTKIPRWPKNKFPEVEFELTTAMKSTGETMAIGRTFEESLMKAMRSSEYKPAVDWDTVEDEELIEEYLKRATPDRLYAMLEALYRGHSIDKVSEVTGIHKWYVERYARISNSAKLEMENSIVETATMGFTNHEIQAIATGEYSDVQSSWLPVESEWNKVQGKRWDIDSIEKVVPGRTYKQVDTCAGEFRATTPYYYSSRKPEWFSGPYEGDAAAGELRVNQEAESIVVVGGGPIRIGQGVEFDYCAVHAIQSLREEGIETHVVNNNPETVSTDYDTSDGLFFEPITAEEVADVIEATGSKGVMLQFGGQTSVNIAGPLQREIERREIDCKIMGTSVDSIDLAEDRDRFNNLMGSLEVLQPVGGKATDEEGALVLANTIGYPVLMRPSYVLGGRAMQIVENDTELKKYLKEAVRVSPDNAVLIDQFLSNAIELDVDAVSDGTEILIGGIMEHVESAGVHSGDSACMIPPVNLDKETLREVREITEKIAQALKIVGLLNIQLAIKNGEIYVLEANPRASRTVPFVSKATGVPIAKVAAKVMSGKTLKEVGVKEQIPVQVSVKEVVLPFSRLPGVDPCLGPEMKSTGEIMSTSDSFGKSYAKAQVAIGKPIPISGNAIVDLDSAEFPDPESDRGKELIESLEEFFQIRYFDDEKSMREAIANKEIDIIISRDRRILEIAVEEVITYFSTCSSAEAAIEAIKSEGESNCVEAVGDRKKIQARWGLD
ncbi:MAG: carbamoyl-phosphate synthase large subunit [Halobacteriales archaeon]